MHTNISGLPQRVIDYLDALDFPVRVLQGRAWSSEVPTSWRGAAGACGTSLRDCETNGVTVMAWATDNVDTTDPFRYVSALPGELTTSGQPDPAFDQEWVTTSPTLLDNDHTRTATANGERLTFARIGERAVWIAFPLDNLPDTADLDVLLGEPIDAAKTVEESRRAEATAAAREQFLNTVRGNRTSRRDELTRQIAMLRTNISTYEQGVVTYYRQMNEAEHELAVWERGQEDGENDVYAEMWDRLAEHPKITSLTTDHRGHLVMQTVGLNMAHPRTRQSVYLGQFTLTFPVGQDVPRMINNDNRRNGWDHPHVSDGIPCWGGSHTSITQMMGRGDVPAALEYCIQYLESFNPSDSYGEHATWWDIDLYGSEDDYSTDHNDEY